MHNIKLVVAYDGTNYFGWQKNNAGPSIEEEFEKVLSQILQRKIVLQAASRTDRGVHAAGQVLNFFLPEPPSLKLQHSLNALLPSDIRVLTLEETEFAFHPTLDVKSKTYRYEICYHPIQLPQERFYSWHYPVSLNLHEMRKAAQMLIGTHDFTTFCNQKKNETYKDHVRTIEELLITPQENERLSITISAPHFLYKMVRNFIGTLVYVGAGKLTSDNIQEIINQKNRVLAGMTAPAHGLTLQMIRYL